MRSLYKKTVLLVLFCISSCSKDQEELLDTICTIPCYSGPKETLGVGGCKSGVPICDSQNNVIDCDNETLPNIERCDLVDNDCDGLTDNNPHGAAYCELGLGVCARTREPCISGEYRACNSGDYGPDFQYEETRCDGLDNDCDGLIDEMPDPEPPELCYDGSPGELWMPGAVCRPGKFTCRDGEQRCVDQILPQAERCDRFDNDCDGFIDESVSGQNIDILFTIDRSGSMDIYYESVLATVQTFANAFTGLDQFKFALIIIPGITPTGTEDSYPQVVLDFTDAANIVSTIESLPTDIFGGSEASWDVLWLAAAGFLPLSWREDSIRYHILWTDEEGHTFLPALYDSNADGIDDSCRNNQISCTFVTDCGLSEACCDTDGDNLADCSNLVERGVINALQAAGHTVYIFTALYGVASFDDIAAETGGDLLWLTSETAMVEQLFDMFSELCYLEE